MSEALISALKKIKLECLLLDLWLLKPGLPARLIVKTKKQRQYARFAEKISVSFFSSIRSMTKRLCLPRHCWRFITALNVHLLAAKTKSQGNG
jgi:hypothetical protein